MQIRNSKKLKSIRSRLRTNMPAPEVVLWQKIRGKMLGVKFRRQFSIEKFILDFYAPTIKLAIEIDGDSHYTSQATQTKDMIRDQSLGRYEIKVLRFTNRDIMDNLEGVYNRITAAVRDATPSSSPYPPSAAGGEGTMSGTLAYLPRKA